MRADSEPPCFCFRGLGGEVHYCERHGGGISGVAVESPSRDLFEPHPVVLLREGSK